MMPDRLSKRVISDRLAWVAAMLAEIHTLPLGSREAFFADAVISIRRNLACAAPSNPYSTSEDIPWQRDLHRVFRNTRKLRRH
jgi:hypothetical protein